jgi:hypothetical protein
MTSSDEMLYWLAVFACRKWQNVMFRSIDHCIVCWPYCWERCWILQDMDDKVASCVCYVTVATLYHFEVIVLATGRNSRVGSRYGSTRNRTMATGLNTPKTRTVAIGPVLPPKTRHFKFTILAPIKYLSSDRIVTWSVCRLCSFSRSFTFRSQIWDRTNIRCVAIENPPIWRKISRYLTATLRILVESQIWEREVKARLNLHNLRTDHVMIRSELKYLTGTKVGGTAKWNHGPGRAQPKNRGFISGPGNKPAKRMGVGFLAR